MHSTDAVDEANALNVFQRDSPREHSSQSQIAITQEESEDRRHDELWHRAAASDDDAPSPLQKRIADCQEAIMDQTEPNLLPFIQDKLHL